MSDAATLHELAEALMPRMVQAIASDIDSRLREHRLTFAQRRALKAIRDGLAVTPTELAQALEVDGGSTTRLIDRLVAKGFCHRRPRAGDRRSLLLEITEPGQAALAVTQGTVTEVLSAWLSGVDRADIDVIRRVISTILAHKR